MTDNPFMPIGSDRPYDDRRCGYTPTLRPEDACLAPATWHVAWDADLNISVDCDEHMAAVERSAVYFARHRLSPDCIMPGAEWYEDRCVVPSSAGDRVEQASRGRVRSA
jgi:hypothetical protein